MPDYLSSGIWLVDEAIVPGGQMNISYEKLKLPVHLAQRFKAWQNAFDADLFEDKPLDEEWFPKEGRELAHELKRVVGAEFMVLYGPPGRDEVIDIAE